MSLTLRRRLVFVLLLVASLGAVATVNTALAPVTLALAEEDPVPVVKASFGWVTFLDFAIRVIALVIAWLTQPKPADPDPDRKTFP